MIQLRFQGDAHDGETYAVGRDATLILGRDEGCSIRLRDHSVSRVHCQIKSGARRLVLTDLQSTTGTFVNGERVVEVALKPGDQVNVGRQTFVVQEVPDDRDGSTAVLKHPPQ